MLSKPFSEGTEVSSRHIPKWTEQNSTTTHHYNIIPFSCEIIMKNNGFKVQKNIFKIMQQGNSEMNNKEDCSIDLWMACWWKGFWVERRGKGNGVELEPNAPLLRTSKLGFGSVPLTRFYPLNENPLNNEISLKKQASTGLFQKTHLLLQGRHIVGR